MQNDKLVLDQINKTIDKKQGNIKAIYCESHWNSKRVNP